MLVFQVDQPGTGFCLPVLQLIVTILLPCLELAEVVAVGNEDLTIFSLWKIQCLRQGAITPGAFLPPLFCLAFVADISADAFQPVTTVLGNRLFEGVALVPLIASSLVLFLNACCSALLFFRQFFSGV